jgi:hypothetical protein
MQMTIENDFIINSPSEKDILEALNKFVALENSFILLDKESDDFLQIHYDNNNNLLLERHKPFEKLHLKSGRSRIPKFELEEIFLNYFNQKEEWDKNLKWVNIDGKKIKKDFFDYLSIISSLLSLGLLLYINFNKTLFVNFKSDFLLITFLALPFAFNNIRKWKLIKPKDKVYVFSIIFFFILFLVIYFANT